jgi:light-regulated signal transduction histidine kinase (bacteriophytochrome)
LEALLPQADFPAYGAGSQFEQLERAIRRLQTAKDVTTICGFLAAEVRRLTGYDRVKAYCRHRWKTDPPRRLKTDPPV